MVALFSIGLCVVAGVILALPQNNEMPEQNGNGELENFRATINILTMNQTVLREIQDAIMNKSYETWKSLVESQLTEYNFNQISKSINQSRKPENMTGIRNESKENERNNFTNNPNQTEKSKKPWWRRLMFWVRD